MTISINQQVDYLWKKLGYGLTKTSTPDNKNASNESIPSPLFMPGDQIWMQSQQIPYILPVADTLVVKVHNEALGTAIRCDADITSPLNRSWLTNLADWVPPTVGPTYQPKVYLDNSGSITPQTTGVQLYANGANNDDEWFFDFQSGVLHFIGNNLPAHDFTGKSIFVCGARYIGSKGFSSLPGSSFGDISIDGNTISSTTSIHLDPMSGLISANNHIISNVAYPVVSTDVATMQYVLDKVGNISANSISQGNSVVAVNDSGLGNVTVTIDGTLVSTFSAAGLKTGTVTIGGSTISSTGDLIFAPSSGVASVATTGAFQIAVGSTAQRPSAPDAGYVRFNTDTGTLECYDGGNWISSQATISSQIIPGDGVNAVFTLDKSSDANGIMAMINGVVQIPNVAYQVTGTQITFAEPPTPVDTIEIRYIGQMISSLSTLPNPAIIDDFAVPVSTTGDIIDMFGTSAYRTAKYSMSVNTSDGHFQSFDCTVVHNGSSVVVSQSPTVKTGGTESVTITASIASNTVIITATASHVNTTVKVQKTYFTV